MALPVDFEKMVRLPPLVGNKSYPYRISARDLMLNFNWAALRVGESEVEGIELVEDVSGNRRTLRLTGSAAKSLPFSVSSANGQLTVTGGFYQFGATGEWIEIAAPFSETGSHVYAVIDMDEDLEGEMQLEIRSSAYDETLVVSESSPYNVTQARVLIALADSNGVVTQYRHGNFTLGIWQIDGNVTRWPETTAGTPSPS